MPLESAVQASRPSAADGHPRRRGWPHEPEPSPEALLLRRSGLAQKALLVEIVLVAMVLAFDLAMLLDTVPDWLGPNLPPDSEHLQWPTGDVSSIGLTTMGTVLLPSLVSPWVWWGVWMVTGVLVWRWAMHASTLHAGLDALRMGGRPRTPIGWGGLFLFVVSFIAVFAAGHYASRLWRESEPRAGTARLGWLPIAWCTVYVLRKIDIVPIAPPLVMGVAGLALHVLVLGLGIALIRRIDARTLQRLEQARRAWGGSAPARG